MRSTHGNKKKRLGLINSKTVYLYPPHHATTERRHPLNTNCMQRYMHTEYCQSFPTCIPAKIRTQAMPRATHACNCERTVPTYLSRSNSTCLHPMNGSAEPLFAQCCPRGLFFFALNSPLQHKLRKRKAKWKMRIKGRGGASPSKYM